MIKKIVKKLTSKNKELVKVYSHPRSGTHFLEAFLAANFYPNLNLKIEPITWGHWSNRKVKTEGNPYGKLFGNHYYAFRNYNDLPKLYIVRDGRAVAYSVWKTPNFLHTDVSDLSFKEFLRTPIDWQGSPSNKVLPKLTILEHWAEHVNSWYKQAAEDKSILIIKYEDLINAPYQEYLRIHDKFFKQTNKINKEDLKLIEKPVGLLPNNAKIDAWKTVFDDIDNVYYNEEIRKCFDEFQ